jgi:hypothetical protein
MSHSKPLHCPAGSAEAFVIFIIIHETPIPIGSNCCNSKRQEKNQSLVGKPTFDLEFQSFYFYFESR